MFDPALARAEADRLHAEYPRPVVVLQPESFDDREAAPSDDSACLGRPDLSDVVAAKRSEGAHAYESAYHAALRRDAAEKEFCAAFERAEQRPRRGLHRFVAERFPLLDSFLDPVGVAQRLHARRDASAANVRRTAAAEEVHTQGTRARHAIGRANEEAVGKLLGRSARVVYRHGRTGRDVSEAVDGHPLAAYRIAFDARRPSRVVGYDAAGAPTGGADLRAIPALEALEPA